MEAAELRRPKIGLVLGGGGARGAAHVGVLKVLKELRIPIDYIAGTSMGAIVGGLYASGLSPEEIEEVLNSIDWRDLFTDTPPEKDLPFRQKGDRRKLFDFEWGFKNGRLVFPRGIIFGQKLGFLLKSLTFQVTDVSDFDLLPIPFRAIATDIETGELVVLEQGNLAEAMRASMSIPGIFTPVEVNSRILVDGGVVKNLPVDIAKEMGADLIIAVNVGTSLSKREKLESAIDITMQVIGIMTLENLKGQIELLGEKDLLITPELGVISTSDFEKSQEIIQIGEHTARKALEDLKKFSVSPDEYGRFLARHSQQYVKPAKIDFVKIEPPVRVAPQAIKERIRTQPGTTLDTKKLQRDLTRIYAIGDFEQVDFKITTEGSKKGLLIDTKEKPWGPNYVRFGLNLIDDFRGDSFYNILMDYRMTQVNNLGAEWKNEVQIGRTRSYFTEFYQPLDYAEQFFLAPRFKYERSLEDVYSGNVRIAECRVRSSDAGIDAGVNLGTYAEARIGITGGEISAGPIVGGSDLPSFEVNRAAYVGGIKFDQLDNSNFPKYGIVANINLFASRKGMGADHSYDLLDFGLLKASTYARHTVIASLAGATSIDDDAPFYDELTLGGFLSLSGYRRGQLRGQHKGIGMLIYYNELFDLNTGLLDSIYIGGSFEGGNVWNKKSDIDTGDLLFGGSVFLGADTIFGPLYLGYGRNEGNDEGQFYLFLGQTF